MPPVPNFEEEVAEAYSKLVAERAEVLPNLMTPQESEYQLSLEQKLRYKREMLRAHIETCIEARSRVSVQPTVQPPNENGPNDL